MYFVFVFIKRTDFDTKKKIKVLLLGSATFLALFLLFFVPYVHNAISLQSENIEYFAGRIGTEGSSFKDHYATFKLYNPFVTEYFYLVCFILALIFFKKTRIFVLWFIFNFSLIKIFVSIPKTHIYNYLIPLNIVAGLGLFYFLEFLYKKRILFFYLFTAVSVVLLSFLSYQTYTILVDHEREYPWDEKKILWLETKPFYSEYVITFGFPHYRGWKEVDKIIPPDCRFITNENKSIPQTYLRAEYGHSDECMYVVDVKNPFELDGDGVKFAGLKKSKREYQYRNSFRAVTSVYRLN